MYLELYGVGGRVYFAPATGDTEDPGDDNRGAGGMVMNNMLIAAGAVGAGVERMVSFTVKKGGSGRPRGLDQGERGSSGKGDGKCRARSDG